MRTETGSVMLTLVMLAMIMAGSLPRATAQGNVPDSAFLDSHCTLEIPTKEYCHEVDLTASFLASGGSVRFILTGACDGQPWYTSSEKVNGKIVSLFYNNDGNMEDYDSLDDDDKKKDDGVDTLQPRQAGWIIGTLAGQNATDRTETIAHAPVQDGDNIDFAVLLQGAGLSWYEYDGEPLQPQGLPSLRLSCACQKRCTVSQLEIKAHALWAMQQTGEANIEYCWRKSYGRGVGSPLVCPPGKKLSGPGTCFVPCPEGYRAEIGGSICYKNCPDDGLWDEAALLCEKHHYGRTAGYTSRSKCKKNSLAVAAGGCDKYGLLFYPKCREGYKAYGCCLCRADTDCPPHFSSDGLGIGLCAKPTHNRGKGEFVDSCRPGQDKDAALCYPRCRDGYHGVGPVCWSDCPSYLPHDCAAGCARDATSCGTSIFNMVKSSVELVAKIIAACEGGPSAAAKVDKAFSQGEQLLQTTAMIAQNVARGVISAEEALKQQKAANVTAGHVMQEAFRVVRGTIQQTHEAVLKAALHRKFEPSAATKILSWTFDNLAVSSLQDPRERSDGSPTYDPATLLVNVAEKLDKTTIVSSAVDVYNAFNKPTCLLSVPPSSCDAASNPCGEGGECADDGSWTCKSCGEGLFGPACLPGTLDAPVLAAAIPDDSGHGDNDDHKGDHHHKDKGHGDDDDDGGDEPKPKKQEGGKGGSDSLIMIIGAAVGGVVFTALLVGAAFWVRSIRRKKKDEYQMVPLDDPEADDPMLDISDGSADAAAPAPF